jgi:hypothetical protein
VAALSTNEIKLIQLAGQRFTNNVSVAEVFLLDGCVNGKGMLVYHTGPNIENDLINSPNWSTNRIIRADFIEWLCTDPQASSLISRKGIQLQGFRIDGTLNLQYANIPFPFVAANCVFSGDIILRNSHLLQLTIAKSYFKTLDASEAQVEGDVLICDGCRSTGTVDFDSATIAGGFDCYGSSFVNTNGNALFCDYIKIGRALHLDDGFNAQGRVTFIGATVNGQIICNGGRFNNPGSSTLVFDGSSINSGIFLKDGFESHGEVRFTGATILGNLECDGAHFYNQSSVALFADGAQIRGSVLMRNDLTVRGIVDFEDSSIERNFDCRDAEFYNPHSLAFIADRTRVGGSVLLSEGFNAYGCFRLSECTIDGTLDCTGGQFNNPNECTLNTEGSKIGGSVFLRNGFSAVGQLWLVECNIGGDLDCGGGKIYNSDISKPAIATDGSTIAGNVNLNNDFTAEGEVRLSKTIIHGNLYCGNAHFINPIGFAIRADEVNVEGDAVLMQTRAEGEIGFFEAAIDGSLLCNDADFSNSSTNDPVLDMRVAKIGGAVALDYIHVSGIINISGSNIGLDFECIGAQLESLDDFAIIGSQAIISGSIVLDNGFKSDAGLLFSGTKVGHDFECENCQIIEPNTNLFAINLLESDIQGSITLWTNFFAVGVLNFKGLNVGHYFFLKGITPSDKMILDLRSATIGTLIDETNSWPTAGNLLLDNMTYNEIYNTAPTDAKSRIAWLHLQPTGQFFPQPYQQLAEVLHKMGHDDDSAEVMVEKNKDYARCNLHWTQIQQWPELLWYYFIGLFSGYGYCPGRAFWWSLGFIIFGSIVFLYARHIGIVNHVREEVGNRSNHHGQVYIFNSFIFSLETFVPLLELDMAKQWKPTGKIFRLYFYLHKIFGWILTTLWIGGLTGLIKT